MVSMELRSISSVVFCIAFSLGQALLSVLASFVPQWRGLTLVEFFLGCCLVTVGCLHESPKWLAGQGRIDEAFAVVCACADRNSRPRPPPLPSSKQADKSPPCDTGSPRSVESLASGASQLFDPRMRPSFLIMSFA